MRLSTVVVQVESDECSDCGLTPQTDISDEAAAEANAVAAVRVLALAAALAELVAFEVETGDDRPESPDAVTFAVAAAAAAAEAAFSAALAASFRAYCVQLSTLGAIR